MVSRLLAEAHQQPVVEIRVHHPLERHHDLECELQERLGLKAVRVLKRGQISHTHMLRRLGGLAAPLAGFIERSPLSLLQIENHSPRRHEDSQVTKTS